MEGNKIVVFTYRYMWRLVDSENVNFKIVSDTVEGLKLFESNLLSDEAVVVCGKEYLHEYDCSKIGLFETLKTVEKEGE